MEAGDDTVASIDPGPAVEGVGAMLRARRLELGLSQADVANMVKLPPRRIEAMEQERWGELPDGPYLRGFLRNIARALHLDATVLLSRVDASLGVAPTTITRETALVPQGVTHATLPRRSGPADDRRGGRTLVYGAFVFAIIAALIAWSGTASFDRAVALVQGTIAPTTQAGAKPAVEAAGERAANDAVPAASSTASSTPSTASSTATPPADAAVMPPAAPTAAPAAAPAIALSFHFNEDSWVEVKAADGKVLLQRLNAAGSEQTVDGEAPFSLVVGNAKGVALRFRGQPVDLAPYTRDSVARFTLS